MRRDSDLSEASFTQEGSDFESEVESGVGGGGKTFSTGVPSAPNYGQPYGAANYGGHPSQPPPGYPPHQQPGYGGYPPQQQPGYGGYPPQQQHPGYGGYPPQPYGAGQTVIPYGGTTAVIVDPNVTSLGSVSGVRAGRVAIIDIVLGVAGIVGAVFGIARGEDMPAVISQAIIGVFFVATGVYGRGAVRSDEVGKMNNFGKLMIVCTVVSILVATAGLIIAVINAVTFDEDEESDDDDDEGEKTVMKARVNMIIATVVFVANIVLCPLFTSFVRKHASNVAMESANRQNMPAIQMAPTATTPA